MYLCTVLVQCATCVISTYALKEKIGCYSKLDG